MAARFWVGGAGTWDAVNTANWSATTGGAGGASAPTSADTVTFDNLSGSGIVTTAAGAATSGITYDSSTLTSLTLGANITIASSGNFTLTRGSIDLNNFTIDCYGFFSTSTNTRSIAFGASGAINYQAGLSFNGTNFSYTGTSSIGLGGSTLGIGISTATGFTQSNALNHKVLAGWIGGGVSITSGSVFNDFTFESGFTGAGGAFTNATMTLYGSVTLLSGMSMAGAFSGTWTFARTSGTQTITSAGKALCAININGPGGNVTLGDALDLSSSNRTLTVTSGTFTTSANSYSVSAATLSSSGSLVRTITLNASTVTLIDTTTALNFTTGTNLTFNAGTSQINCSGSGQAAILASQTFSNVSFSFVGVGQRRITGSCIFNNLTLTSHPGAQGLTDLFLTGNQTVNGTFICAGNTAVARCYVRSSVIGTSLTITANAISANDCDFRDITLAGAAAGASPTRAGNCGGNSGIIFPAAKTVYWNLAGTQNWFSNAWATSPTGTPAVNNFPLAQDTAIFTNSGSAGSITPVPYNTGTIDASGRTSALAFTHVQSNTYYGSYILGSGVTISGTFAIQTFSGPGTQIFTSAGKTITFPIVVEKHTGTFELGDATTTTNTITHTRGTFNANIYNLTCTIFLSSNSNTRTIRMGSGLWTLTGTGTIWNTSAVTGLTFAANTANILLSNDSTTSKELTPSTSLTLNKLTIGGTSVNPATYTISGNYAELAYTRTITSNLVFSITGITAIGVWSVSGAAAYPINIRSSSGGTRAQINVATRTSGIDYLNISDINIRNFGSGVNPYLFYAGDNSINGSLNSNIAFISSSVESPQTVYLLSRDTNNNGNPAGVWITPNDWDSNNNIIHMIGPGGGGNGIASVSGNLRSAAGGGGGGAYVRLTNFPSTPGSNISYYVWDGVGTAAEANAQVTGWSSNTYIANGGQRGTTVAGISSTGGRGGAASAITGIITASFAGGDGGSGAFANAASTGHGSGGGGGAGGPFGKGGNGGRGVSSTVAANIAGGGGGGGGGGSNGGDASEGLSGAGGNNYLGVGGGAPSISTANDGANGAGSSGATSSGSVYVPVGGRDMIADTLGSGGGAGGHGGTTGSVGSIQNYGGGGAGYAVTTAGALRGGGGGGQPGAIFIIYPVRISSITSNMFLLF